MGNSNASHSSSQGLEVDPFVQILERGFNVLRSANEHVSLEQFERLFSCFSNHQSTVLWSKLFPNTTLVDLNTYAESARSLEAVRNDSDRIRFVLSLTEDNKAGGDELEIPYIYEFLQWCSAVNSFNDDEIKHVAKTIESNFLPLDEGRLPSIDSFARWCGRHCPEIAHDFCSCITESLRIGTLVVPLSGKLRKALAHCSVNPTTMWLISNAVAERFRYNRLKEGNRSLDKFNMEKMSHIHKLFDSSEHGLSSSRLKHFVFDYDAPSLTFIEFPDQSYCLALDGPYKEEWTPIGGSYTALYSIKPKFCRLLIGENLVYCNFSTKSGKRCIAIGRNSIDAPIVQCDEGLSTGNVFGLPMKLVRFEVWGCGGDATALLRKQADIKEWEQREAARQKNRKFKGEAWEDSPDRVLMEWGGVKANHSETMPVDQEETQETEEK